MKSAYFYTVISRDFECFYYFKPEATFLKKNFLEILEDHFVVECSAIENAKTLYKSYQSEAKVKTNYTCSAKRTNSKGRYFATKYLNFLKIKYLYMILLEIFVFMCPLLSVGL